MPFVSTRPALQLAKEELEDLVYSFQNELAIEQDATIASNCYVILESLY